MTTRRELADLNEEEVDDVGRNRFRSDKVEVELPLASVEVENEETFGVERFQELWISERVSSAQESRDWKMKVNILERRTKDCLSSSPVQADSID